MLFKLIRVDKCTSNSLRLTTTLHSMAVNTPHSLYYPFRCSRRSGLFPVLGYKEQCCYRHSCIGVLLASEGAFLCFTHLRGKLLSCRQFLTLGDTSKQVPSDVWGFQFIHIVNSTWYCHLFKLSLVSISLSGECVVVSFITASCYLY